MNAQTNMFGETSSGTIESDVQKILEAKPNLDHEGVLEEMLVLRDLDHIRASDEFSRIMQLLVDSPAIARAMRRHK